MGCGEIGRMFAPEMAARILATPLSSRQHADTMYWQGDKRGIYTVKSGYWLAKLGNGDQPQQVHDDTIWQSIWRICGPPKLQHFIWSVMKGNLAVMDRLVFRHITQDSSCQICGAEKETIIHYLLECNAAKEIWSHCKHIGSLVDAPTSSFVDLWAWLNCKFSGDVVRQMITLMWVAWRCRNLVVFEGECSHPVVIAAGFLRMVMEYNSYAQRVFKPCVMPAQGLSATRWTSPPIGYIKINTDAHMPNMAMASLGVVWRDA
ncbi:uncharacterized protein LOC110696818 [Chenopodium quinoa]|uniref:uncharacterized protein LOC110696818 n=1 Tax=Chenopodium quinoa TaxID=63459 RepID=UPI000B76C48A|nr:uncharacterized protein LOC110696818 [Chenopodium quinoa]